MEMLSLILALSSVMWYLIQRGKDEIWGKFSFGKWITIGVSCRSNDYCWQNYYWPSSNVRFQRSG